MFCHQTSFILCVIGAAMVSISWTNPNKMKVSHSLLLSTTTKFLIEIAFTIVDDFISKGISGLSLFFEICIFLILILLLIIILSTCYWGPKALAHSSNINLDCKDCIMSDTFLLFFPLNAKIWKILIKFIIKSTNTALIDGKFKPQPPQHPYVS